MYGILKRSTDQISIVTPVLIETRKEFYSHLKELKQKHNSNPTLCEELGEVIEVAIIDQEDLNAFDRYFRNAWEVVDSKIDVSIPKAQEVHLNNLRKMRNEKLKELDVEFQKALETGDDTLRLEVVTKKQELRDMPENVDFTLAVTPEEIKDVMPECLQ
jgi:hypothetical protein